MIGCAGLKFVSNPLLLDGPFEDWSKVRSPGRARRRRRQGHRQNIRFYHLPSKKFAVHNGVAYGHPETIRALERALAEQNR